jgi:hypothetical protein
MFGLVALTALAAMAFVGASTATGITALCKSNEKICSEGNLVTSLHVASTTGTLTSLLSELGPVLCLNLLVTSKSLQVGDPQKINGEVVSFTGCGTSATHNNCIVKFNELPQFALSKTELNLGELVITSGTFSLECPNLFLKCTYDTPYMNFEVEGALHQTGTGHGMITAEEEGASFMEGTFCPEEMGLDFLLEPLEHIYVAGVGDQSTALCKVHEEPCKEANLVKTINTSTEQPLLKVKYSGKDYAITCKESSASASVGELGTPQKITIEKLTWTGCTIPGGKACTIESIKNGILYLYKIGLNIGKATSSTNEIEASCADPGFTCVFASEPKLRIEGAGHTGGTGNGMFESNEPELENVEGDCEGPGFLYGLYEPLTSVNVVS